MAAVVPNAVGWYILEGFPWWPVYICDVTKLRPTLHLLGSGHQKILKKARDFPLDFIVVYYFGSHDFSLVGLKNGVLRPWDCAQKDQFLKGHPKHLTKKKSVLEELQVAVHEAEEYLSQPEDIRLPPHMVPSDLDPTLEPPPELVVPEDVEMESDTDEDMETQSVGDGDSVENEEQEEEVQAMRHKKPKKKKEKEKERKDEKKTKKKKNGLKDENSKKTDESKRKNSSEKKRGMKSASPAKVAKTTLETDVTSERAVVKKDNDEKKWLPPDMTSEALSVLLEKEIRWILVNCQFEEMTTKMVRKMLEERLKIDLRHHKASIKEGVARVIASMEDEDMGDSVPEEAAVTSEGTAQPDLEVEHDGVVVPVSPSGVAKTDVDTAREKEVADAAKSESTKRELEAVSKHLSLALELEPKILDALDLLKSIDHVDKDVLAASTLQPRLVKLRAHPSSRICELVTFLVKKWEVEDCVPAPKPITKEEILDLKTQLEFSETSHDELLVHLNRLSEMALTIDHLKKTGIARAVSNLRQHGNDKVSAKAHELRQKWIKQSNEQPADSDSGPNSLKTLQTLYRILGQQGDGSDEQKLQRKQLAALEQLHSMSLDTKDIIDSKVGIAVSKLRKSSNEKVAKLAKNLRKKWQTEAKKA